MSKIYFRYAAMGAGKTLDLLKTAHNYERQGYSVWLVTSAMDSRGNGRIYSRVGIERDAYPAETASDLYEIGWQRYQFEPFQVIFVDECQFLNTAQVWQLFRLADKIDATVFFYGLRSDYTGQIWPASAELFVFSDKVEELKTLCWCGKKATMNALVIDGKQEKCGSPYRIENSENIYVPLCRQHWTEERWKGEKHGILSAS